MNNLTPQNIPTATSVLAQFFERFPELPIGEFYTHGVKVTHDSNCISCATPIKAGQLCHDSDFITNTFGDAPSLKSFSKNQGYLCCHCRVAISYGPSTMQFSYAAVGRDNAAGGEMKALKIFGVEDFIAAVYNPLDAPFVMVRKERKKQHMIWKGKVNLHDVRKEDLLFFSSGETTLFCHPQRVLNVAAKEQELLAQVRDYLSSKPDKKAPKKKVRQLKELVRFMQMNVNLCAPAIVFNDCRHESYGITDSAILERIDALCEVIRQFSSGDRQIYAHLRKLAYLKKTQDFKSMVAQLSPREVDMKAIIEGKPPAADADGTD